MNQWGMWLVLGLVLIVIEVMVPAFVALFFGLSALIVALLCWIVGPNLQPWVSSTIFAGLAVVLLLGLRGVCTKAFVGKKSPDRDGLANDLVGHRAVVTARIEPGGQGKVEFRGANWQAESGETLEPGVPVRIVKQESIVLTVERMP